MDARAPMASRVYKDYKIYSCFVLNRLVSEVDIDLYQEGLEEKLDHILERGQPGLSKEEVKHEIRSNHHMTNKVLENLQEDGLVTVDKQDGRYRVRITREGVLYSCQAEELVLKHLPEIFDCSVVGVEGHRGGIHATIAVEMRDSRDEVQAEEMLTEINRVMAEKALPRITFLTFESALLDLGVTGKKLKRVLRERLAEAQDQGAEPQA